MAGGRTAAICRYRSDITDGSPSSTTRPDGIITPLTGRLASYRSYISRDSLAEGLTSAATQPEEPLGPSHNKELAIRCLLAIMPVTSDEAGDAAGCSKVSVSIPTALKLCWPSKAHTIQSHGVRKSKIAIHNAVSINSIVSYEKAEVTQSANHGWSDNEYCEIEVSCAVQVITHHLLDEANCSRQALSDSTLARLSQHSFELLHRSEGRLQVHLPHV